MSTTEAWYCMHCFTFRWLQAEMELTPADEHGKITQQLTLRAIHHRIRSNKPITGQLHINTWLGSTHEVLGRMHSGLSSSLTCILVSTTCVAKLQSLTEHVRLTIAMPYMAASHVLFPEGVPIAAHPILKDQGNHLSIASQMLSPSAQSPRGLVPARAVTTGTKKHLCPWCMAAHHRCRWSQSQVLKPSEQLTSAWRRPSS